MKHITLLGSHTLEAVQELKIMTTQNKQPLPALTPFTLPNVPFSVRCRPHESFPPSLQNAFEAYLAGSSAPYPIYVYQNDYERFCLLVQQGKITLKTD
ncbi:TPA: hypothetical protein ACPJZQ_004720 [Vibrio alginolyticus]